MRKKINPVDTNRFGSYLAKELSTTQIEIPRHVNEEEDNRRARHLLVLGQQSNPALRFTDIVSVTRDTVSYWSLTVSTEKKPLLPSGHKYVEDYLD